MSNKLTGTQFRTEFLKSLNILAPRIAAAIERYGDRTVDVVNLVSTGTASFNNIGVSGIADFGDNLTLTSTDADADENPVLNLVRASASPDVDDILGKILFNGKDDAGNTTLYASIRAEINDETDSGSQEDGVIVFDIIKNNSQKSALELKNNEAVFNNASADIDFRIESDDETHMFFIDANENRISIGDSVDTPAATLEITNHATAGAYNVPLVQLNSNDVDQVALDINAANITSRVIDITADAVTTANVVNINCDARTTGTGLRIYDGATNDNAGSLVQITQGGSRAGSAASLGLEINFNTVANANARALYIDSEQTTGTVFELDATEITTGMAMDVAADALTTGGILNLVSDSSDTSARTLVTVKNDNTAATGTVVMHLINDALGGYDDPILLIESTADETSAILELKNSNASTTGEPILMLTRSDNTAEADDMSLGTLIFRGVDSGNANEYYAQIKAFASDVTAGDEGGLITFLVKAGGTAGTAVNANLFAIGGEDVANGTGCSVVVNNQGIDCDFRVESDDNTHMLFVDGNDNTVAAGGIDATNHKDGFAVFNDFNVTTFENTLADGHFGSAEVLRYSPGADDTLTSGQLYFLHTDGTWNQTDADAVATGATQLIGIGLGNAREVGVLLKGYIRIPSSEILNLPGSGACDGLPVYVSTTAGHLDFTAPTGTGDFVRVVGYAIDDDSSDVLVYINPSATHVELA